MPMAMVLAVAATAEAELGFAELGLLSVDPLGLSADAAVGIAPAVGAGIVAAATVAVFAVVVDVLVAGLWKSMLADWLEWTLSAVGIFAIVYSLQLQL